MITEKPLNNMITRKLLLIVGLMVACLSVKGQTPYARLELKADRFFSQREWAQAAATYYQMLELRPEVAATYGKAIVANAVRGDSVAEMELLVKALNAKIPFDSVLTRVKSTSFQLGKSNLYGDFLLRAKAECPWMRRPIDGYLLRYYIYRNDGPNMMAYSRIMLQGDETNTGFLTSLAQGAMLCGDYDEAVTTYQTILALDPENYNALLALGNYYLALEETEPAEAGTSPGASAQIRARDYLARANALRPTPYVTALLRSLP
jgi:predicted Zn-dependent protease